MHSAVIPTHRTPSAGANDFQTAITPLLDLALTETNSQGAYLYSSDIENWTARLAVWFGISPIAFAAPVDWHGRIVKQLFSRQAPLVLQESAWEHPGLSSFPEFRKNRFEGVISIPILEAGHITGLLNVCRTIRAGLKPREFAFLLSLAVPVGALLAASTTHLRLERQIEQLTQQLEDRKLLERAKAVIQSRFEWTEEQAYFGIRNLSRRRRIPMREIAEEIISSGVEIPEELQ